MDGHTVITFTSAASLSTTPAIACFIVWTCEKSPTAMSTTSYQTDPASSRGLPSELERQAGVSGVIHDIGLAHESCRQLDGRSHDDRALR